MMHREFPWARSVRYATIVLGSLLILGGGCNADKMGDKPEVTPSVSQCDISAFDFFGPPLEEGTEVEGTEDIDPDDATEEIEKLKKTKKGKALHKHLDDKGFEPGGDKKKDFYGQRTRYKHPDKPNVKITHTLVLQNYEKKGTADAGAIGTLTLTTKDQNETQTTSYDFVLIAPDGKFEQYDEFTATENGEIVDANSWYSCLYNRISQKCQGPCVTALVTCSGTWAGYLVCLGVACGGCLTLQYGCCGCDCSWWCKWGVGCCDR
jgi:hypothetical protein